jgi:hypothetical protein
VSAGNKTYEQYLKTKSTTEISSLESVRQIIKQNPAKASGVRQPMKRLY